MLSPILFVLLLSVATAEPIESTGSADFLAKLINFKVIHEPSHPMFHEGIAYYWMGQYVPSPELPQTCVMLASHPEWPFDGSVFPNGTHPSAVLFGCRMSQMCRGKKCYEPLTHFNVVTYCLTGIIMLLLVCLFGGESKGGAEKVPQELDNIFLPLQQERLSPLYYSN